MPNKEKSVKTVPKSNGNATTMDDAIRTEATADVITTDVKKGANNKKRDKHKNKDTVQANNNLNANENCLDGTAIDDDGIRAVSEELLKRLQCNGTSISVCKSDDASDNATTLKISAKQGDNGLKSTQSDKSKGQQKTKQSNNNNNNSKAHNKNCQNQSDLVSNVNTSSNHIEISSDGIQCNGGHTAVVQSTEYHATSAHLPGTSKSADNQLKTDCAPEQIDSDMTSKEIVFETPSCSNQHSDLTTSLVPNETLLSSLPRSALSVKSIKTDTVEVTFKEYENELQMPDIMRVIQRELSEPYSIYTYRYFIHNWPKLCFLAMDGDNCIGAIVCKLDLHRQMTKRGYIAMLAVDAAYRKLKVGTTLVQKAIEVGLNEN